jgi:2-polyprenyl-3-methyl-5-hydroxy-6-metoxy-1,4-benzoquinol methylase
MDEPTIDAAAHAQALAGLRRINTASKASEAMAAPIIHVARRQNLSKLSMLDIACGGGDVPIGIATIARAAGVKIDLTFLDRSSTTLKIASIAAAESSVDCRCVQADLLDDWNAPIFDVVTCSLFLHHVPDPDRVIQLLSKMRTISRRLIVISDLRRSTIGLFVAWAGSRVLSTSGIVHHDAPASVRAAWTIRELKTFAARANLPAPLIQRCFPFRMLLTCEPAQ